MSELCDPTDAELRALCASATGPSHLESLIPLANYRDIVALRRKLHEFPELANRARDGHKKQWRDRWPSA